MTRIFLLVPLVVFAAVASAQDAAYQSAMDLFERRIVPIMSSPNPSSCAECHLGAVDLKSYLQKSPEKTFIALRDQGLIDVQEPALSKILEFIRRADSKSSLVTIETRAKELEAFQAWIEACCKSDRLVKAAPLAKSELSAAPPVDVIRHARKDRVLDSFVANVWAQIERCAGCHSTNPSRNPNRQRIINENGAGVLWVQESPNATLDRLVARGLINPANPLRSMMLLKPTMQVAHKGGVKMEVGDQGYKQFRAFIEDYAAIVGGRYASAAQLPRDNGFIFIGSEVWLKVAPTPERWADKVLGVTVHPFDERGGQFAATPVAHSDRRVFGKGQLWQHNLILLAPQGSPLAQQFAQTKRLPSGRYLLRFYLDASDELKQNWQTELIDRKFFVGQTEVTSDWPPGYGKMTVARAPG